MLQIGTPGPCLRPLRLTINLNGGDYATKGCFEGRFEADSTLLGLKSNVNSPPCAGIGREYG